MSGWWVGGGWAGSNKLCLFIFLFYFLLIKVRQPDISGRFSARFYKVGNFLELLFAFLHAKPPSEKGSAHKWSKMFPFKVDHF